MLRSGVLRFYCLITLAVAAGWTVLAIAAGRPSGGLTVCLFRNVTGLPCPACGTTHSVLSILQARWAEAAQLNLLGYAALLLMLVLPGWLLYDVLRRRRSLYGTWLAFDQYLKKHPAQLALLLCLIVLNWIWKISQ
jgi:hypothetical protein